MATEITENRSLKFLVRITRYIFGYTFGLFLPATFAVGYASILLRDNLQGSLGGILFLVALIASYFLNFALSAFIMGVNSRKFLLKFWVLFSQPMPLFLAFMLLLFIFSDPGLDYSEADMPDYSIDYLIVIGTFMILTSIGAYLGAGNPIQKLIQKYSKK